MTFQLAIEYASECGRIASVNLPTVVDVPMLLRLSYANSMSFCPRLFVSLLSIFRIVSLLEDRGKWKEMVQTKSVYIEENSLGGNSIVYYDCACVSLYSMFRWFAVQLHVQFAVHFASGIM